MASKTIINRASAQSKWEQIESVQILIDFLRPISVHRKQFCRTKTKNWLRTYRKIEFRWVVRMRLMNHFETNVPLFQMEPTPEQIKCAIEHLESEKNASNLWSSIASDLGDMNGEPKRSITFWKRTFKRIIKRLTAKRELYEYINRNYVSWQRSSCTLKPLEQRLLRAWTRSKVMNAANTEWMEPSNTEGSSGMSGIESISSNCRICLASTSSKMTHLFGEDDDRQQVTLLDKLNYCSCLSSMARIDDGFPQYICMSCSVLLESAYQLKLLCAKTEERLNEMQCRSGQQSKSIANGTSYEMITNDDITAKEQNELEQPTHIE